MFRAFNKRNRIIVIVGLVVCAVIIFLLIFDMRQHRMYTRVQSQYREMLLVSQDLMKTGARVAQVESRIGLSQSESIPVIVENLLSGMGLKEKLQSIKPFGGGPQRDYEIQEAEIIIDNLTMNELVNVLYGIYTVPAGLIVTSSELSADFADRTLIDARMSLKLISYKKEVEQ